MPRLRSILCVTDVDRKTDATLARAMSVAGEHQARLTVMSVMEPLGWQLRLLPGAPPPEEVDRQRRETQLQVLRRRVADAGGGDVAVKVAAGNSHLEALREVVRNHHDLVVSRAELSPGESRLFHGEAMRLLRKCPCPVWLEREPAGNPIRRILVSVDVDQGYDPERLQANRLLNERLLELGLTQAVANGAELHLAHAWRNIGDSLVNTVLSSMPDVDIDHYNEEIRESHRRGLDGLIRRVGERGSADAIAFAPPRLHLPEGSPAVEIPALAARLQVDLVVMGTLARSGVAGFLMGNTAESIIDRLECSLLALKPDGFVSPVV